MIEPAKKNPASPRGRRGASVGGPLLTGGVTRSGEPCGSTTARWYPLSRTITVQEGPYGDRQATVVIDGGV